MAIKECKKFWKESEESITKINPKAFAKKNINIALGDTLPSTFGLFFVRGFKASISLSIKRLKPIAKFRANTAQSVPKTRSLNPNQGVPFTCAEDTTIAININGKAKTEC